MNSPDGAADRIGLLVRSRFSSGALVTAAGTVCARVSVPTGDSPLQGIDGLVGMVAQLRRKADRLGHEVVGVGVGFPGVIGRTDGRVRGTRFELRAWRGTPLAEVIGQRTGVSVTARNDVVCALLGEAAAGVAVAETDVLLAYSSAGVGGAIMLGGQLLTGRSGAAGHLGHVPSAAAAGMRCSCGGTGHLDSVASASGMIRWYQRRRHLDSSAAPQLSVVAAAADRGDADAREALAIGGSAMGHALGGIANLLQPDVIVLAGESSEVEHFRAAVVDSLRSEIIPGAESPDIRVASLGADAPIIGAALSA